MVSTAGLLPLHPKKTCEESSPALKTTPHYFRWCLLLCASSLLVLCSQAFWLSSPLQSHCTRLTDTKRVGANACSGVKTEERFDCYPQSGASEAACIQRGCCWLPALPNGGGDGVPTCFYPAQYRSYGLLNYTSYARGLTAYYRLLRASPYPGDVKLARMSVTYLSDDTLLIKIRDAVRDAWEVLYPELDVTQSRLRHPLYRVQLDPASTNIAIYRKDDNTTILDMRDAGGLVLSERMLQLSARINVSRLYGLGERRGPLAVDTHWHTYTLYNHDTPPVEDTNLYGSHPFYVGLEKSGKSHGVLMFNSDAMDVVTQPGGVTWRVTGGALTLLVTLGPSAPEVVSQYTTRIGRPALPPYWALGFHLCKFNYGSLNETKQVWQRTREAGIPFDTQWNDLDYMHAGNDFTLSENYAGLGEFVRELHAVGMHYVLLIDPGVSASEPRGTYPPYDVGMQLNVFIRNESNMPFVGKVWNRESTVWPDFSHPNSTQYWRRMLAELHNIVPFDGAWIDMNEPSNFVSGQLHGGCAPENLPYMPRVQGGALSYHTLCQEARHSAGPHQHMHNLHAYTEAAATHRVLSDLLGKRPLVLSRASSPGLGAQAAHWSGDVLSSWHDLRMSIPEMLSSSLFGMPLTGADVCGFRGNTTRELCLRWMQLGAFYPFSRNHNSDTSSPQDPVFLGAEVTAASRDSLRLRYALLPYLYTQFWLAHSKGLTVATPLWFLFPSDETTHELDTQFLLGDGVLVCPVLEPGVSSVRAYLPPAQTWYLLNETRRASFAGWGQLLDNQTVLVKGGSVLTLQPPAVGPVTTRDSRQQPLELLVAPCPMRRARGLLYWDDGDTMEWHFNSCVVELFHSAGSLSGRARTWSCTMPGVERVLVMDQALPTTVTLNNRTIPFSYDPHKQLLVIDLSISLDKPFHILWH